MIMAMIHGLYARTWIDNGSMRRIDNPAWFFVWPMRSNLFLLA